ncbi:MAG: DUF692 family multinuclear iron-containing protein [Burkholderiales bacterium]
MAATDRVGIAWRPEIAAGLYLHLDAFDVIEVIADNYFHATRRELDGLKMLARHRPMNLHGVGLGLASASAVDRKRLDRIARLFDAIEPQAWSEHLAFVRAGGIEIGHLCAPPRTGATSAGTIENIERAARAVGVTPQMENIATLIDPPACTLNEAEWISGIVAASGVPMLLDLHNLYANACNRGENPLALLTAMPLDHVTGVHLSGGKWIDAPSGGRRLLDDHLHEPPDEVLALLTALARRVPQALTVVIERDGNFPAIDELLADVARARLALAKGRAERASDHPLSVALAA